MERLVELLQSPSELVEPDKPAVLPPDGGALRVDALSFAYPARPDIEVLHEVDLTVEPGEMVAIVGPSGAGKSTLFDLLLRFYDPTSGSVRFDGIDLRELALVDVRDRIGFVPQDSVLFAGNIAANLTYGKPDATASEMDRALVLAHAREFVSKLPDGLQTVVGEGGVGLSGGQRQRLAIARALLTEPRILLLDEATSALDAESEDHIRQSIAELKGRCSILVIAHRLSTVRQADRILVMEDGRLVASGPHDELVQNNELYARFARIQFTDEGTSNRLGWRSTTG